MAAAISRYVVLSAAERRTLLSGLLVETTYNRMSRIPYKHKTKTVGISPRKISNFLLPTKDELVLIHRTFVATPASVGRFALDRLPIPLKLGSRSIIAVSGFIIRISGSWPSTASTWTAVSG
jgi:hypothetical protein